MAFRHQRCGRVKMMLFLLGAILLVPSVVSAEDRDLPNPEAEARAKGEEGCNGTEAQMKAVEDTSVDIEDVLTKKDIDGASSSDRHER